MQQSGKFGVTGKRKRSGLFRAVSFLLSVLLVLASLSNPVIAHSAHSGDRHFEATEQLDVGSNETGDGDASAFGHCRSVSGCLSCLPASEQILQTHPSSLTVDFARMLIHLGPTLEKELPPPRL